jgi:hypothetical protein
MNQSNTVDNIIDEIIKENKIQRFALELQNTLDGARKAEIKSILHMLEGSGIAKDTHDARNKLNDIYQKIDECALKKKWNRLQVSQRVERVKNYLSELIPDAKKRKPIEDQLVETIKNGAMATAKYVTYDQYTGNILAILDLNQDSETKEYKLGKSKPKPKTKKQTKVVVSDSDDSDDSD